MTDKNILNTIAQAIYDKKGINIIALDIRKVSSLTDYFVIAEGNVDIHVKAIADAIIEKIKEKGIHPQHIEGYTSGDWIVIDYGDILIHLFVPELRQKYALEELWHEGKIYDLEIEISKIAS